MTGHSFSHLVFPAIPWKSKLLGINPPVVSGFILEEDIIVLPPVTPPSKKRKRRL